MGTTEYLFLAVFFGLPGVFGFWLARGRDKNPVIWGLASALFPFVLLVLWYQKPDHEVPGHFRKCASCGAMYAWKHSSCSYCRTPHD